MTQTDMINAINAISIKIHLFVGFNIGLLISAITNSLDQIVLTFVLGFAGAAGAGFAKLLLEQYTKHQKKNKNAKKDKS